MAGQFVVSCTHCQRVIANVTRIASAELDQLQVHLLTCCPREVIGLSPGVEATLRHFHVTSTRPRRTATGCVTIACGPPTSPYAVN
jgi:hypothetical protein